MDESSIVLEIEDTDEIIKETELKPVSTELKPVGETNVNEKELSSPEVNDNMKVNNSNFENVKNGDIILDIPQNIETDGHDSELLNDSITKENKTEETYSTEEIEENEPKQEPCLLPTEIEKPVNSTEFVKENDQLEDGSPEKEALQVNQLQSESVVMKLVDTSEEKDIQESVVKDEIIENSDSEIKKDVETNEIIHENITEMVDSDSEIKKDVETNEIIHENITEMVEIGEDKNIDIDLVDDDDDNDDYNNDDDEDDDGSELSFKQINDELKILMDEGMEESDDDNQELETLKGKSEVKSRQKEADEAENPEISKIDLINSSDSDGSITEEKTKNSIVIECKDSDYENEAFVLTKTENEDIITSGSENIEKCDSLKEHVGLETVEENISDVRQKDTQITGCEISDNCNYSDDAKVTEKNSNDENTESDAPNNTSTMPDGCGVDLQEDDHASKTGEITTGYFMDTEPSKPFNILIENPHSIAVDESVQDNLTSDGQEEVFQDSTQLDQDQNLDNKDELEENEVNYGSSNTLNEQETNQSEMLDNNFKLQSMDNYGEDNEDNFDKNYEDEELNRSDEGSCDIYKGLSDSGSYVDDKGEGSQFGESVSSELQSGSGGDSEEDETSGDEDDDEKKTRLINQICDTMNLQKKDSDKPNDKNPDSPMTYDKALAIINQNRVKKIDDEEFFDMFTEELNKVSEKSGSDSDIAIVDEYLMEPEEPAKKNQQKSSNVQNAKHPPRHTGPGLTSQSMPPENYPGTFNQSIHAQHGHPIPAQTNHPMQRVNFTQGSMYQQYDQNMHIRGQLLYNQYGHPSSSIQDPHMFNPPVAHPDVNFSTGMFNHPHSLCPVSESSYPSTSPTLKVRTVTDMNSTQTLANKNYSSSDQAVSNVSPGVRTFERQEDKNNYVNLNSSAVSERGTGITKDNSSEIAKPCVISHKKTVKSRTPILDLLGLDEKALKLLKKVLGLNSIKRELMRRDLEWQKKCLEKNILKSELRQSGRKRETRYRNKRFRESDSSSLKSSSEQSSEGSSITSSCFSKGRNHGSSSENDSRKVDVEGRKVYVTVKRKTEKRTRNKKEYFNFKKACLRSINKSPEPAIQEKKTKFRRKPRKKMTQKQSTVVKSQSGTFTVDPLTASSQSSDSEVQSFDDQQHLQELKRKMKSDLASGKNKLSNMFTQHSFGKTKEATKKVSRPFDEIKGPLRKENFKESRKLPKEILETLAKEDKRKKRNREMNSGSDDHEQPKKIRKKSQKMKVKSKAADQNYIPCLTGGATEFGLSRLDKDGTLTLAEKASNFRTDQLYGGSVKRITSKELMKIKKKQARNDAVTKKKKFGKSNAK